MTDLLRRELAPVTPEGWEAIDSEARSVLGLNLGARKLVDFDGPHGWGRGAVDLGRVELLDPSPGGVHRGLRKVRPLAELRVPFHLEIMELDSVARGARNPELAPLVKAAEAIARAEDSAVFRGEEDLGIRGILQQCPHDPLPLPEQPEGYPPAIVMAIQKLAGAGVTGPYALAVGDEAFGAIDRAAEDGYPIRRRVSQVLEGGPIVRSGVLHGAVVLSRRGGDFTLTVGQDLSIGYADHDRDRVELYLTETFTFQVAEPAAAIPLGG